VAENRTVAGVHFPHDSLAGALLGVTLGEWVAAAATGGPVPGPRTFSVKAAHDGAETTRESDPIDPFTLEALRRLMGEAKGPAADRLPTLASVWEAAQAEWAS
jgi:hypothetical protein